MAVSWLKTGSQSAALQKKDQQEAQTRQASMGKMFRFFLKPKEEAKITFVDGELDSEGFLIPPRFYEHMVQVQGKWETFVCPEQTSPGSGEICPICAAGDRPSLVSLFTVIDHRGFSTKEGVHVPYSTKILAAKTGSMEILAKAAIKRGGLMGCTFEVSRIGAQAPAIGDVWDFCEKGEPQDLVKVFMGKKKDKDGNLTDIKLFVPADYEKEINFYTGDQLLAMGIGAAAAGKAKLSPGGAGGGKSDYGSQL